VLKLKSGENDIFAPVVPQVLGHIFRCPCKVSTYGAMRVARGSRKHYLWPITNLIRLAQIYQ